MGRLFDIFNRKENQEKTQKEDVKLSVDKEAVVQQMIDSFTLSILKSSMKNKDDGADVVIACLESFTKRGIPLSMAFDILKDVGEIIKNKADNMGENDGNN